MKAFIAQGGLPPSYDPVWTWITRGPMNVRKLIRLHITTVDKLMIYV